VFRPGQRILELNCGPGLDAIHLAARGIQVVACDISPKMIQLARERVTDDVASRVDFRVLPIEDLQTLEAEGPFDGAFSNFSGLNCVEDLPAAARNLARLLKPGASLLVCIIGHFVPWEMVWFLAHGNPGRAFARVLDKGELLDVNGLRVRRPSVPAMARLCAPEFELRSRHGVGIAVPPSYMEHWARRYPKVTKLMARTDDYIERLPLFRNLGDCVLLEFQRK
jgi:SAM-dependent methyltransferase